MLLELTTGINVKKTLTTEIIHRIGIWMIQRKYTCGELVCKTGFPNSKPRNSERGIQSTSLQATISFCSNQQLRTQTNNHNFTTIICNPWYFVILFQINSGAFIFRKKKIITKNIRKGVFENFFLLYYQD